MAWMQTASGVAFDLSNPKPEMVKLYDIATALSTLVRFTGHAGGYTVAEHCVRVCEFLLGSTGDKRLAMAGLLHDAHEAYLGDVSTPVQFAMGNEARAILKSLQNTADAAILAGLGLARLGLDLKHPAVKEVDLRILLAERNAFLGPPPQDWDMEAYTEPLPVQWSNGTDPYRAIPWQKPRARYEWLARFGELSADLRVEAA